MNRMLTSVIAFGAGMAAYNYTSNNNMLSGRKMKRLGRKMKKALF
ncbi:YrzQ family protein [Bacillus sp. ISL-39]|nr:YrzQ family protein [Bacillus sp. ISL-39]